MVLLTPAGKFKSVTYSAFLRYPDASFPTAKEAELARPEVV